MGEVYESGVFTIASNLSDDNQPWLAPEPSLGASKLWIEGPHMAWLLELLTNRSLALRGWCLQDPTGRRQTHPKGSLGRFFHPTAA
jgi:hypothetical protein